MTNKPFTSPKRRIHAWQTAMLTVTTMLVITLMTACDMKKTMLTASVEAANRQCPIDYGDYEMTSIKVDNGNVVMTFEFDDDFMEGMREFQSDDLKDIFGYSLALTADDDDVKKMFDIMNDTGTGMRLVMTGTDKGDPITISFTPNEVKNIASGNVTVPDDVKELFE